MPNLHRKRLVLQADYLILLDEVEGFDALVPSQPVSGFQQGETFFWLNNQGSGVMLLDEGGTLLLCSPENFLTLFGKPVEICTLEAVDFSAASFRRVLVEHFCPHLKDVNVPLPEIAKDASIQAFMRGEVDTPEAYLLRQYLRGLWETGSFTFQG